MKKILYTAVSVLLLVSVAFCADNQTRFGEGLLIEASPEITGANGETINNGTDETWTFDATNTILGNCLWLGADATADQYLYAEWGATDRYLMWDSSAAAWVVLGDMTFSNNVDITGDLDITKTLTVDTLDGSVVFTGAAVTFDGLIAVDSFSTSAIFTGANVDMDGKLTVDTLDAAAVVFTGATGVTFDGDVTITGNLDITYDLTVDTLDGNVVFTGESATFDGLIAVDSFSVSAIFTGANVDMDGKLTVDTLDAATQVFTGDIDVDGDVDITQTLTVDTLDGDVVFTGASATFDGLIAVDSFSVSAIFTGGDVDMDGKLTVDTLDAATQTFTGDIDVDGDVDITQTLTVDTLDGDVVFPGASVTFDGLVDCDTFSNAATVFTGASVVFDGLVDVDTLSNAAVVFTGANVTFDNAFTGGSTVRGSDTFASNAAADTVVIAGAVATDFYFVQWTSDPGCSSVVYVVAGTGSLFVNSAEAVVGTPTYDWFRMK